MSLIKGSNKERRERLDLIINATGIGIWDWQVQSGELTFNDEWAQMLGYTTKELLPIDFNTWSQNVHPEDLPYAQASLQRHFDGEDAVYQVELRLLHKDRHYVWVLASGKVVERAKDNTPMRMIGMHLDISERKQSEESLQMTSQLLQQSQRAAQVGGWELDLKTGILFWTDETYRIHETSPDEFNPSVDAGVGFFLPESRAQITDALDRAMNEGEGYDLELETFTTKGRKIDVRTTCIVTQEGGVPTKLTGIFHDISEQKAIQRNLEKLNADLAEANEALKQSAHFDSLTGLPNRYLLADRMQQVILKNSRNDTFVAIAFIDLDSFKEINDGYGHDLGDDLLKAISKRLQDVLREGDTLARIGGDEFVAILDDLHSLSESEGVLQRLLDAASAPLVVDDVILNVSASIGVTVYPLDNNDPDQLLRHADQAMYIAKQKGKNCFHIFDVEKDAATKSFNEKITVISQALNNQEFTLFYQPKVDLKTKNVMGAEALIRWDHPKKGILGPHTFLPDVERNTMSIEIGRWVIKTALAQLHEWQQAGHNLSISVNISPLHLQQKTFVDELAEFLNAYPEYRAGTFEIEIVESSALSDVQAVVDIIAASKALGVHFSIDDFGVGYSSLSYLKQLPVEYLKLDRSFVQDMLVDMDDRAMIEGIIQLASVFNLTIVAEGVESPEIAEDLLSLGCDFAQGYGIAKPMPAAHFCSWLVDWELNPQLVESY